MNRRIGTLILIVLAVVVAAGCGQDQKYGSESIADIKEQEDAQRLGQRTAEPAPKGTPQALDAASTPTPKPSPTPQATPTYFDVSLVPDSPYYQPGNQVAIKVGVTLRVTNRDGTPERSGGRSYTAKNGSFDSGLLKPGKSWTFRFDSPGRFEIVDEGLPFATATLEVIA